MQLLVMMASCKISTYDQQSQG